MNPLHIYCRLRDIGVPKDRARYFCRAYEFSIFKRFLMKHPKNKSCSNLN
jgi:hypothetical protein